MILHRFCRKISQPVRSHHGLDLEILSKVASVFPQDCEIGSGYQQEHQKERRHHYLFSQSGESILARQINEFFSNALLIKDVVVDLGTISLSMRLTCTFKSFFICWLSTQQVPSHWEKTLSILRLF